MTPRRWFEVFIAIMILGNLYFLRGTWQLEKQQAFLFGRLWEFCTTHQTCDQVSPDFLKQMRALASR